MTTEADQVIQALHDGQDQLSAVVGALTSEQLTAPSAASEWDVSQVLSHLGSGAVITQSRLEASLAGQPPGGIEVNRAIWARWDAMAPQERADAYQVANLELLARYDSLDADTRQNLRVDLGFLPAPVDLATAGRFRLNEFALHSWDVRVALDPTAVVQPDATALLLDHLAPMFAWLAKPAALQGRTAQLRVDLSAPERSFGLALGDPSSLGEIPAAPDGVLTAPAEAWLRLATGRLGPAYTPAGVSVTGAVPLETLRLIFTGF